MPYYLSPIGNDQQCDANGNPFVGGKIYTYLAGTSTPAATYTDATSGTSQANPIILNSLGLPASAIWILGGQSLKFVIQDSTGVLIRTIDNVTGVNDTSFLVTSSEWISSGFTPTYINGTSFSVVGDKTSILQVNRRVQTINSGGTIYSTILTSVYSGGITTVTLSNDSSTLDSGLSVLLYALLSATNPSVSTAVTQPQTDNSTKIATTAFVANAGAPQLFPIIASVAGNALTINLANVNLDFRSGTLTTGTATRIASGALSITVPSTATLGSVSGTPLRVGVAVAYNGDTPVLCVINGTIDESALYSPTTISSGSNTINTVYSAIGVSASSPMRLIGYVDVPNVTAGTYATITQVQSYGGALSPAALGYGQSWQAVTRTSGTTYYNTTGKQIIWKVLMGASTTFTPTVGSFTFSAITSTTGNNTVVDFLIPAGYSYSYTGTASLSYELR